MRASPIEPEHLWPPAFGAWIKIAVCYEKGHRRFGAMLRPLALTVAQFDALANLYSSDGMSQQELAEKLLVTKGNVTGLVNRLAERGLVERKAHPVDRRTNRLVLTASGRTLARNGLIIQRSLIEEMLGGLSAPEQESLRDYLGRIIARLDAAPSGE